jgi:hypothetical protein
MKMENKEEELLNLVLLSKKIIILIKFKNKENF